MWLVGERGYGEAWKSHGTSHSAVWARARFPIGTKAWTDGGKQLVPRLGLKPRAAGVHSQGPLRS